jgi:hypothetical protein
MASRYWVGGTAAWDGTAGTKWALTSGGAGGQAVPTSADDVFFTNLSTGTCTISAGNTGAKSITCTGFTGTLAGGAGAPISVAGNVTFAATMGLTYTGILTFTATATITSGGKTTGTIEVNGTGITLSLGDALTVGAGGSAFILSNGSLNLNGFTLTTLTFNSGSLASSIAFGSSNIVLSSTTAGTTILAFSSVGGSFSWTGTGGFVRNQSATATVAFGGSGGTAANAVNLTVNAGASALTISSGTWFKNLNFTGSTCSVTTSGNLEMAGNLTLASGGTYTAATVRQRATGTLTSNGKTLSSFVVIASGITATCADALSTTGALTISLGTLKLKDGVTSTVGSFVTTGTTLKYLESTTSGVQATISDTTGTNTVTYLSVKDSSATGGAIFDATSTTNVNAGNNTGWLGFGGGGSFLAFF